MKKTILTAFCAMLAAASLHSCLDFDMPNRYLYRRSDRFGPGSCTEVKPIASTIGK